MLQGVQLLGKQAINYAQPVNWAHPLNRGLVSWWMVLPQWFGGNYFRDLANRNRGTLTNMSPGADWTGSLGRPGGRSAIDFDGVDDEVQISNHSSLNPTNLTMSGWFYMKAAPVSGSYVMPFAKGLNNHYELRIVGSGGSTYLGGIKVISGGNYYFLDSGGTTLSTLTWYRLAMTWDATATKLSTYINGRLDRSTTTTNSGATFDDTTILRIGSRGTLYFQGLIDDVRFYNRILQESDLKVEYDESRQGYPGMLNRIDRKWMSGRGAAARGLFRPNPMTGLGVGGSFFSDPLGMN